MAPQIFYRGTCRSYIVTSKKYSIYLIELLFETEIINLVQSSSCGSTKVCAELCSEGETNVLSINKFV